jgi:hypothetical protein
MHWPLAPSFDHPGLISGNRALLVQAAAALIGERNFAAKQIDRSCIRVGLDPTPFYRDPAVETYLDHITETLRTAGYPLYEVPLPRHDVVLEAHAILTLAEARDVYAHLEDTDIERLGAAAVKGLRFDSER